MRGSRQDANSPRESDDGAWFQSTAALFESIVRIFGRLKSLPIERFVHYLSVILTNFFACERAAFYISTSHGENLEESIGLPDEARRMRSIAAPLLKKIFPNLTDSAACFCRPGELVPSKSRREEALLQELSLRENTWIIPLRIRASVIGLLVLRNPKEAGFLNGDPALAEAVATLSSLLVRSIMLYKREQINAAEIELSQDIFEFLPDGVFILKPDKSKIEYAIVRANLPAVAMHGYRKEELIQRSFSHLQDLLPWLETLRKFNALQDGQTLTFLCQQKRRDGSSFPAELGIRRIQIKGEVFILLSCCDLEQRGAGKHLISDEAKYAFSPQASSEGHWVWDTRANTVRYSPRWSAMLGYEAREVSGEFDYWYNLIHHKDLPHVRSALATHLRDETEFFDVEYRMRYIDGSWRWMLCHGSTIRDSDHRITHVAGTQVDITQRKNTELSLIHGAFHDPLTDLPNRLLLSERLRASLEGARGIPGKRIAVFCIDIDRFKSIRNICGQSGSDEFLMEIALRLGKCVQSGDTLAHIGGDDFAIVSENIADAANAAEFACSLQEAIASPVSINQIKIRPTVSIGITLSDERSPQSEEILLRDAETAMYRARAAGGACHVIFDSDMHEQVIATLQMEEDIKHASENSEFELFFQPLVSLPARAISGFEALCRWRHPKRGLVSPAEFVPAAEKTGLILEIGRLTLNQACRQLAQWRAAGYRIRMAVNFSARQFESEDIVSLVRSAVRENAIPPDVLEVEITESIAMTDHRKSAALLTELRGIGVRIAIDDFGTGYSSLSYLKNFPINTIKIDQFFMRDIPMDPKNVSIVSTIITLAKNLQLQVVAEGVETREQLIFLEKAGCHYVQGFLFGKPVDTAGAAKLLEEGIPLMKNTRPG